MTELDEAISQTGGATFSPDRIHRYRPWRRLSGGRGRVAFVALNPSSADERADDPTVRRCIGFAEMWRFAYVDVLNIFAFRATDPRVTYAASDPVGPETDIRQQHPSSPREMWSLDEIRELEISPYSTPFARAWLSGR